MHICSIKITRAGHFGYIGEKIDPSKPFICVVETESKDGKMELRLSPDLSHRILEIISEELAVSARETAEAMIARHGKDFAIGTLVLSAKFIAEGKPLINRTSGGGETAGAVKPA